MFQTYFRFVTMNVNSVYIFEHLLLSYNKEFLAWGTLENIQVLARVILKEMITFGGGSHYATFS